MARPTAKDLAEAAGVSPATIDRVLNNRPNVSESALRKVNEAIERIGFARNTAAMVLRRKRSFLFRFVLPTRGGEYLEDLLQSVEEARAALRAELIDIAVESQEMADPHQVAAFLAGLDAEETDGVAVMAPESPQVRDALSRLLERGVHVIQFLSGQEKLPAADFVGIDNCAAGATAGKIVGRFVGERGGAVAVVAETLVAQDSIERRRGFDAIIGERFGRLRVLPSLETYGDAQRAKAVIERTMQHNADVVALYVATAECEAAVTETLRHRLERKPVIVVHERSAFSIAALRDERIDAIIVQDPGHAVRSAIRIMRARVDRREPIASQEKIRIEVLFRENL